MDVGKLAERGTRSKELGQGSCVGWRVGQNEAQSCHSSFVAFYPALGTAGVWALLACGAFGVCLLESC